MTTVTCYALESCGQFYNRIMEVFTDLSHATLYEQGNREDIQLLEKDKNQLLDQGIHIHSSTVKFGG